MKYSEVDAGKQKITRVQALRARPPVRMRMPRLRYRDSLRKNQLRAPLGQNYAESNVEASDSFRLSSFSTHSTKNA